MNRRAFLTCAAVVAALTVAGSPGSQAQTYPSEPITLIVAWPAGGGSDISMRLIADALSFAARGRRNARVANVRSISPA